jgi:hypothetical protein
MKVVVGSLCALALAGCVMGRQAGASVKEHTLYRQARTAATLEDRLAAAHAYQNDFPDGAWTPEVRGWLESAHADYYARIRDDPAALRGYLAILPQGSDSAREVRSRLGELEVEEKYRAAQEFEFEVQAAKIDCELKRASAQRQAVVDRVMLFVSYVSAIRSWGEPTSSLDHDFLYQWRIRPPRSHCALGRCTKTEIMPYAIPEERQLSRRVAVFDVVIEIDKGGVSRAVVTGPELFSRIAEALELKSVAPDDAHARLEALTTAIHVVQNAFEKSLPALECDRPPVSPVLILRECRGVRAQMIAGRDGSEEDRIVIEPYDGS